jgi:peroxiredoxin
VIVAFIPGAYTSTCHEEMCNFRDSWSEYAGLKAQFIAVSPDGPHVQKAWAKELGLTLAFGSDLDKENIRRWGVVWKAWWGTVAKRATFVVDRANVVRFAEVLASADDLPDYEAIKACLARLS